MPDSTVYSSGDTSPRPDPSQLTTAALQREIAHLSDRVDLRIDGVLQMLTARLDAIDKATSVFSENLNRVPTDTQQSISCLAEVQNEKFASVQERVKELSALQGEKFGGLQTQLGGMAKLKEEQFHSIQQQFQERDVRTKQESESSAKAVDAALQAAKEAVAEQARSAAMATQKSEQTQTKAIEQLGELVSSVTAAINAQVDDLKGRVTRIEAIAIGQAGQKVEQSSSSGMIIAVISVGVTILLALFAVFAFIQRIPAAAP